MLHELDLILVSSYQHDFFQDKAVLLRGNREGLEAWRARQEEKALLYLLFEAFGMKCPPISEKLIKSGKCGVELVAGKVKRIDHWVTWRNDSGDVGKG